MEERVITFGAIGSFLVIVAIIVQFIVLYLFIRATIDLHFLRKEFEKLKRITSSKENASTSPVKNSTAKN